mmetsp:Transcript_131188/g.365652  ORF Transcript_131188/g.365652 Transcript_131188/m.365652 type:complete len:84 (-) Transcript_131188:116-367(-)|eukprot:CAMPEP_0179041176 /NCGR_PEP_ID=MMETSP0796-20121207/16022_1 /TAXON_ID=73915 /ORGANISM="Pyrodinium bahamense, Strain pbaha01" /LENGTH=83 /DNA_ID=CAMNT_0020737533 /DNA_START=98 /DNA_END=349 /DNA_ORIENTATION=+
MTRGNQRDRDRERAANRNDSAKANSTIKSAESTAEIMRKKQEAAEAKKAAAAAAGETIEKKGPTQAEKKHAKAVALAMSGKQK